MAAEPRKFGMLIEGDAVSSVYVEEPLFGRNIVIYNDGNFSARVEILKSWIEMEGGWIEYFNIKILNIISYYPTPMVEGEIINVYRAVGNSSVWTLSKEQIEPLWN